MIILATICWAILIFIGSSIPGPQLPTAPSVVSFLVHFFEYLILSVLLSYSLVKIKRRWSRQLVYLALLVGFAYALSDETHQLFVRGRNFEAIDLLIDLIAILTGIFVVALREHNLEALLDKGVQD